jgi:hypothetical protein
MRSKLGDTLYLPWSQYFSAASCMDFAPELVGSLIFTDQAGDAPHDPGQMLRPNAALQTKVVTKWDRIAYVRAFIRITESGRCHIVLL